jgi:alpha-ketoglutarate-dependent taurine dioxygenase
MSADRSFGAAGQGSALAPQSGITNGTAVSVKRVAGHIGAEVEGVDLAAPLSPVTVAEIRSALLAHKVIFFRAQALGHREHVAFVEQFGELSERSRPQSNAELDEFPQVLTNDAQIYVERHGRDLEAFYRSRWATCTTGWHTDMSHAVNPPMASVLRAEVVPPFGGDTQWTNLVAAYEGLSPALRDFVDGLRAEHTFLAGYRMVDHEDREVLDELATRERVAVHPVVRVHPETGEKALFVNPSRTRRIVGLSWPESRRLLELLFEQMTRPEYTVRFRWEPGSVAFWDNRSTAHLGATDFTHVGARRTMHRVTIRGDRPVGVDGRPSELVVGEPL